MPEPHLTIEQRLTRIEDIEAIRSLTNKYHFCVNEKDRDSMWPLFTDDAVIVLSDGSRHDGIANLRAGLGKMLGSLKMIKQFIHSHSVEWHGDTAEGLSFLDARYARNGDPVSYMVAGKLTYSYRKQADTWRICRYIISIYFRVPVEVGWAGNRLIY
jgi:ketosteroid isomerase-like protein